MSNRRRKPVAPRIVGILSLAQVIAGIGLLVAAYGLMTHAACPSPSTVIEPLRLLWSWSNQPPCTPADTALTSPLARVAVPTAAPIPPPAARATSAPQPTIAAPSLMTDLFAPFQVEAQQRRLARAQHEPGYAERIDPALNEGRINFLFFGFGETFEPPYAPDYKGSINIFSLDLKTLALSTVTLNHDIRAPEVERYRQRTDHKSGPTKIDQSYPVGGFDVMRATVEDATGLSVDFQLAMDDGVIKRAVDNVFGGMIVPVPFDFDALPVYFDGQKYPEHHYARGRQRLDGLLAVQYMKAVYEGPYDPAKELTVRKQIVIQAMLDAVKQESLNPLFWTKALNFLRDELDHKSIALDFDATSLVLHSVQNLIPRAAQGARLVLPSMAASVYVVDRSSGDGGVEWVTGSANPVVQQELEAGIYADKSMSVPTGSADPYADDLVVYYWRSVRALIKDRLTAAPTSRAADSPSQ